MDLVERSRTPEPTDAVGSSQGAAIEVVDVAEFRKGI